MSSEPRLQLNSETKDIRDEGICFRGGITILPARCRPISEHHRYMRYNKLYKMYFNILFSKIS